MTEFGDDITAPSDYVVFLWKHCKQTLVHFLRWRIYFKVAEGDVNIAVVTLMVQIFTQAASVMCKPSPHGFSLIFNRRTFDMELLV